MGNYIQNTVYMYICEIFVGRELCAQRSLRLRLFDMEKFLRGCNGNVSRGQYVREISEVNEVLGSGGDYGIFKYICSN